MLTILFFPSFSTNQEESSPPVKKALIGKDAGRVDGDSVGEAAQGEAHRAAQGEAQRVKTG